MFVKKKAKVVTVKVPEEFTAEGVEAVIRYCYYGSVDDAIKKNWKLTEAVFTVAHYYAVSDLREAVEAGYSAELRKKYPSHDLTKVC